jgi:hypothetical protein
LRFANANLRGFSFSEHNLQLKEVPKSGDYVEMDSSSAYQEKSALLPHTTHLAVCQRKGFPHLFRRGRRRSQVKRFFWTGVVRSLIENQLSLLRREHAQLEAATGAMKKGVVLGDLKWPVVRNLGSTGNQCFHTGYASFYFDVAWHRRLTAVVQPLAPFANRLEQVFDGIENHFFPVRDPIPDDFSTKDLSDGLVLWK